MQLAGAEGRYQQYVQSPGPSRRGQAVPESRSLTLKGKCVCSSPCPLACVLRPPPQVKSGSARHPASLGSLVASRPSLALAPPDAGSL